MTTTLEMLQVRSRRQWRAWLAKHHTSSPGVWLVFHKAHTGVKSIEYEDTVREALCFGWVDSLIKRLDDDRYALKITPRRPTSKWSDLNRKRWKELEAAGLLTPAGRAAAPTTRTYAPRPVIPILPPYIAKALKANAQGVGVLPEIGAHRAAELRRVDSHRQTRGNTGEAHSRIDRTPRGRKEARLEVGEIGSALPSFGGTSTFAGAGPWLKRFPMRRQIQMGSTWHVVRFHGPRGYPDRRRDASDRCADTDAGRRRTAPG